LPEVFKTVEFVNADEIARGLSPFIVEGVAFQAGRIMLQRLADLVKSQKSFAFETTLSGLAYLNFVKDVTTKGYEVVLFYVWLSSPALAKERVALRVSKGGHNIPKTVIEARYHKSIKNFVKFAGKVTQWYIYNNSTEDYKLIAKNISGEQKIYNFELYNNRVMMEIKSLKDLIDKIQIALDKATKNLIAETKAKNSYLVIADEKGNIKKIPAKDL
jgi:predicted ABC-type ATPase